MIYYIENRQTDPYYNLALEQFVFDHLGPQLGGEDSFFLLWQNYNSIIVGKHQNTLEEINAAFVKEKNISVARRLSGGGAVYHDHGNLNFTFITPADKTRGIDFSAFCEPVSRALRSFGVPVDISGRNDMTVEGKKFSGNAQYIKQGRVMHHGTILYDSDLTVLSQALKPGTDKIESRGIKSLRSRVTNIRPYMKNDMGITDFWETLKGYMRAGFTMKDLELAPREYAEVKELRDTVYAQWSWNYGNSPPHTLRKNRRIEGCGKIEIFLDIEKEGLIKNIKFYGDFFGNKDPAELEAKIAGHRLGHDDLKNALAGTDAGEYFHGLKNNDFFELLLE